MAKGRFLPQAGNNGACCCTMVEVGTQKTEAAQQTITEAVTGVRRVNTLVDEISNATREQLMGISQINAAVAQMDTMTQQNAALVEEIAASAQALEGLARSTTDTVQVFKIDDQRAQVVHAVDLRRNARTSAVRQLAVA